MRAAFVIACLISSLLCNTVDPSSFANVEEIVQHKITLNLLVNFDTQMYLTIIN